MDLNQLRQQKSGIQQICERHGVTDFKVFGSVARGEASPTSDVDFLIDYDPTKTTPWFPGGLITELSDFLGVDVDVTFSTALEQPYLGDAIAKDLVAL